MANPIKIKRSNISGVVPTTLVDGEIAINQADKKLFYIGSSGVVQSFKLVDNGLSENNVILFTDFINVGSTTNLPFSGAAINAGTTPTANNQISASTPGVLRLTSSTTANSGYRWQTDITTIRIGGNEVFTCYINPQNFATTTMRAGFHDATTNADAIDGLYFEYSTSGALQLKSSNNSIRSLSGVIATLALNTWYKLEIVINANATLVTGNVYGVGGGLVGTGSVNTNIPTVLGREVGAGIIATNSGIVATGMVDIDYLKVILKPNR